jgi:hypothetical protein
MIMKYDEDGALEPRYASNLATDIKDCSMKDLQVIRYAQTQCNKYTY